MKGIIIIFAAILALTFMPVSAETSTFVAEGQIRSSQRLSESSGVSAFSYRGADYKYYVHIEDGTNIRDEQIVLCEGYCQPYQMKVVMVDEDELIVFWGVPTIKADHYQILPDGLQLLSRQELGDSTTRFMDAIRLQSGKVLVSWYEFYHSSGPPDYHPGSKYLDLGFAYRRTDGTWVTLPYVTVENHSWEYSTRGALCQHPADNSIWSFTATDANYYLHAVHFTDSGNAVSVDWANNKFISKSDDKKIWRDGELPNVVAVPDPSRNSILLAYQSHDYKFFSTKTFVKGTRICVIEVSKGGNKKLLFLHDRWTERISSFALGLLPSGEFWMAYYPIDPKTLNYRDLYLMKSENPSDEILLGKVSRQTLVSSNYRLLFNLPDGIYSYQMAEEPSPPPAITVFMGKATWEVSGGTEKSAAVAIYATTEAEAMDKLTEYIVSEFPEATNIQFSYEIITADIFKVME